MRQQAGPAGFFSKLPITPSVSGTSMHASHSPDDGPLALQQRIVDRVRLDDRSVLDDLQFLIEWDRGRVPWLSANLRMRQIYRANPPVANGSTVAASRAGTLPG